MHTKDKLAEALRAAGLDAMARKAAEGWYHDFLSPLAMPSQQLAADLKMYAEAPSWPRRAEAQTLFDQHMTGAFDASEEESDAWAASDEGRDTIGLLSKAKRRGQAGAAAKPAVSEMAMRLAFRREDAYWVAYLAKAEDMVGAIPLGSVMLSVVENNPAHKQAFMGLMQAVASDAIKHVTGERPPHFEAPVSAPSHERAAKTRH